MEYNIMSRTIFYTHVKYFLTNRLHLCNIASNREGAYMRLITILGTNDDEILVDMDVKRPVEPEATYFVRWMAARIPAWGVPVLVIAGIGTAVSIITFVMKWA